MDVKTRARVSSIVATAVIAVPALAGCSGDSGDPGDPGGSSGSSSGSTGDSATEGLLQPGGPGDPVASGDAVQLPEASSWTEEDATFVAKMVPHHAQAVEMTDLARSRARAAPVRALADRIDAAQRPEILLMASWLDREGLPVPGREDGGEDEMDEMGGMAGMDGMTGMLTEAEMQELAASRGDRFDRLFLRGMIAHHRGAVRMADQVGGDGDVLVAELAADVSAGQAAEVGRMRDLLADLR